MTTGTRIELFDRVVCGVDNTEAGLAAARAAATIADPEGSLTIVAVHDPAAAVHAGWSMSHVLEQLAADAQDALAAGEAEARTLHDAETRLVQGDPLKALLLEVERREATTVVVGSHGFSRAAGITLGSVSTYLVHEAPCAVLVVRRDVHRGRWPRRIVVGVDGSPDSAVAYEAARTLAERTGAHLHAVTASRDAHHDLEAVRAIAADVEEHDARAIDCLNVASETADLVVVGSRGLRGFRALGSLSERLAHSARSPVLVVRGG
jgi:nucleotide-binding universal stress UspA family protein